MAPQPPLTVTPSTTSAIDRQVLKVSPGASVADVIRQMSHGSDKLRSCAVVVDSSEVVLGIVTERDIVDLTAKQQKETQSLTAISVRSVMTTPVKTLAAEAFQDIFAVLFLFRRYRIRHLPIVNADNQLVGIVTPASIRKVLKPANLLKMRRVSEIMTTGVVQAHTDVPVIFLAQLMAKHRVSCVVIVDAESAENEAIDDGPDICPPVGIVTERDIVQFRALGLDFHRTSAEEVMSAPLFLLDPQDSLWAAHEAMKEHKVRRLVVSWNWGKEIGIITQTSLLRVFDPIEMYGIIDSLQQTIVQLKEEPKATQKHVKLSAAPLKTEPDAEASTETLLGRAIACVELASQHADVSSAQTQSLQQAIQLIQQVCPSPEVEQPKVASPTVRLKLL